MGWSELWGGGGGTKQLSTMSPEQQQYLAQLGQHLSSQGFDISSNPLFQQSQSAISKMLSGDTSAIEDPLMRQYEQEILPGIAQRFGGAGAQGSSAYQNALAGAGGNLASQLGQLRYGARQQGVQNAQGMLGLQQQGQQFNQSQFLGAKPFGYEQQAPKSTLLGTLGKLGINAAANYFTGGLYGAGQAATNAFAPSSWGRSPQQGPMTQAQQVGQWKAGY